MAFRYNNVNINNYANRNNHQRYYLPKVDIKDYNAIIDGRYFMIIILIHILKNIQN